MNNKLRTEAFLLLQAMNQFPVQRGFKRHFEKSSLCSSIRNNNLSFDAKYLFKGICLINNFS